MALSTARRLTVVWGVLLIIALWASFSWPVATQPPFLVQLGPGDSTAVQTWRSATLANFTVASTLTARNVNGVALVVKPASWVATSNPAAGSVASASIAAEAAVRHVADCISWGGDSSGAVTATAGTVVLRDGATGAGTILATWPVASLVAAAAGIQTVAPFGLCGLSLVGTTNTAMTAEFNAGIANEIQGMNLTGYNVQ